MMTEFSDPWYKGVEKAKDKARKMAKTLVAINQATSIVVGKMEAADIDRLGPGRRPTCRITLKDPKRFSLQSGFKFMPEDMSIYFVNKPEVIMDMAELEAKFPEIFEEVHINIKKGAWDGS